VSNYLRAKKKERKKYGFNKETYTYSQSQEITSREPQKVE
jgi:hypothetical protein